MCSTGKAQVRILGQNRKAGVVKPPAIVCASCIIKHMEATVSYS